MRKPTTWNIEAALLGLILLLATGKFQTDTDIARVVRARPAPVGSNQNSNASRASSSFATASAANEAPGAANLLWQQSASEPEFAAFVDWVNEYHSANGAAKKALEENGVWIARERRLKLRELIKSDPASALALAIPPGVRRALPQSVQEVIEERVSARGSLEVFGALAEPGQEHKVVSTFRLATLGEREFQAFVYGRRLGEPTRRDILLNGVAVDELLAVNENPIRLMELDEVRELRQIRVEPVCAFSRERVNLAVDSVAADVGGEPTFFCASVHANQFNAQMIQAEIAGNSSGGGAEVAASPATEGTKKLLLIRVDFSDLPGVPFTDAAGISLVSGLNAFFRESSFGRSGFALSSGVAVNSGGSDLTPTLRMPQTAAYYGGNNAYLQLRIDARNAAIAAGYVLSNYNYDLYCFGAVPGFHWAGLGYIGAPGSWLRSYFTVGVAGHELGHNYGLNHANYWDTGGQSVIGPGSSSEYGDIFDTMGAANAGANHFNARYKSYLNWLQGSETLNVTGSGVYRIYPHDDTNSVGKRVGLRIARNGSTNYWVEFRQKFTGNKWLMNGASLRWAGNGNERSQLLDLTPGSPDDKDDSALVSGRTFSDHSAGVHITTLGKGGTTPESLDIAINLGTFSGNANPSVAVEADNNLLAPGATVLLTATATDPDNDALAYFWDFGDGSFGTNGSIAGKSWVSAGEYVVRCVASDMRGGIASDSIVVAVGNPGTYRISGRVTANQMPVEGVKVSISTMKMTFTDSDGTYTLVGLLPGSYSVSAQLSDLSFPPSGFANPVSIGPNAESIDFSSSGGGGGGTSNLPGSVALTSPAANATFTAPSAIFLAATATASTGKILTRVEFYQGTTKLGEDSAYPYSFTWNSPPTGSHSLTAWALESGGIVLTSSPVTITINAVAPAISIQPQSQAVAVGGNATFNVAATGTAPFGYRWRFNGANLAGANSASLSLFNIQTVQAGAYSVTVTNGAGAITSAIANLTVTCSFTLSAGSGGFGSSGGEGAVSVLSQGGCPWTIANVPAWITITSGSGGSGSGPVSYVVGPNATGSSRSAALTLAGRTYVVTQAPADTIRPTVSFLSPLANASVTNAEVSFSGTADDNDGVLRVEYNVGGGPFAVASGSDNWSATIALRPGTNFVSVRSVDLSGNISLTNSRGVFCSVPATLKLAVNGQGAVVGATNGQALTIGRPYKLTATPTAGYVFSNWTGDVSGVSPTLTFFMESNFQVTANFATNPFALVKGDFNGLFFHSNEVRFGQSGGFRFRLSDKGGYSAVIHLGSRRYGVSGRMNLEGRATNTVRRPGTNELTIFWSVNLEGTDEITGAVSDGVWTATILGDRATFGQTNPAPQAGGYTLLALGTPEAVLGPEGDGYGTASVDSRGVVTLKGFLADKTPIASKAPLSKNGYWPVYLPLYAGQGAILGWITFADGPSTDLDGLMSWTKPALPAVKHYPDGFSIEAAWIGSRYKAPSGTNQVLDLSDPTVVFSGGNLSGSLTNEVALDSAGRIVNLGSEGLIFAIAPSTGLFGGKLTRETGSPVSFKGVVLQKAKYASGYFLGPDQSGKVSLKSASSGMEELRPESGGSR